MVEYVSNVTRAAKITDRVAFVQLELDRMNFVLASARNGGERDKKAGWWGYREEP